MHSVIPTGKATIVVTYLMHLGDLVLTTPFLEVLRRAAPEARIVYVVDAALADLVRHHPAIDEVVCIDKKGADRAPYALWKWGRIIRKRYHPDLVINLHPNERTSFLVFAIGAPSVGCSHGLFRWTLRQTTQLPRNRMHAADMYVDVLRQLGVSDIQHQGLSLHTHPEWDAEANRFYQAYQVTSEDIIVGFNIGSAVPEKRWPPERFAAVARYVQQRGGRIVFFGGPMDCTRVEEAIQLLPDVPVIQATGKFTLGPLIAAIRRCNLFVTNDSGPMHVAVSQKVPIVALYGPSNPAWYGPYSTQAIVLQSTTLYDEGLSMKEIIRSGRYEGVSSISVQRVCDAIDQIWPIVIAGKSTTRS